jgi:hypothetical protein
MDFSAFAGLFDPTGVVLTLVSALFAGMAGGAVAVVLAAAAGGSR